VYAFSGLSQLLTLLLNDNSLTIIPEDVFSRLNNIAMLNLTNNNISAIKSNSFSGMPYLPTLYLSHNELTTIPQGLFDPLGALVTLDLSYNQIIDIELNPFTALIQVNEIDLSNNRINSVRQDFFPTAHALTILNLGQNQITTIDRNTFNSTPILLELNLSDNLLSADRLEGIFTFSTQLQTLWLSGNPLLTVRDSTFRSLTEMLTLHLANSCLQNVTFQTPLRLQNLNLARNFIEHIQSSAFVGLANLLVLDIGSNGLQQIDGSISILPKLQLLNLTQNYINNDVIMTSSPKLAAPTTVVDLSYNLITNLTQLQQFQTVFLAGNPLACSCLGDITWLSNHSLVLIWPDYDITLCRVSDPLLVMNSQNYLSAQLRFVCYFSSTSWCPQLSNDTFSEAVMDSCANNYTSTVESSVASHKLLRAVDRQRCGYATPVPNTNTSTQPPVMLFDMTATCLNWSLTVNWTMGATGGLVTVTVDKISGNGTMPHYEYESESTAERSHIFTLQSGGKIHHYYFFLCFRQLYQIFINVLVFM